MKLKVLLSFFLLFCICLVSCISSDITVKEENETGSIMDEDQVKQGVIRIKFEPEMGDAVEANLSSSNTRAFSGMPLLDELADNIKIKEIKRTFPYAGKFEPRTRARGLHLWYDIYFEETVSITRAATKFSEIPGIAIIEPQPIIHLQGNNLITPLTHEDVDVIISNKIASQTDVAGGYPFDDPRLPDQWHYANDGAMQKSLTGADINLINAWRKQTGHPDVIVAIVDGGLSPAHEDISDNYFINLAELYGASGVDDDNNGYIDDIYGWNFVDDDNMITGHDHGMHVAGTVAAVNNNGKGVAGVAGGDGTPGSGVKVLSCQVFKVNPADPSKNISGNMAAAIKYGADQGAVISQNSWSSSGNDINPSVREAIDYFIETAGFDENGVQVGPMAGGVVIFAAGNDDSGNLRYPGAYEPVVAVSAMAPDYKKAYYSNYGSWVDITAPGGAADYGTKYQILSLSPTGYAYMQGTSMACPHVSGIAALMVAEYGVGKQGYDSETLKGRLLNSVNNINVYNPGYAGWMGSGYVDAAKCLYDDGGIPPEAVTDLEPRWNVYSCELTWSLTSDSDMYAASEYLLYISKKPFDEDNINDATPRGPVKVSPISSVGDKITHTITNLTSNTDYYIGITGIDIFGNRSPITVVAGKTLNNNPPVVTMDPLVENIVLCKPAAGRYTYKVTDPEGHNWNVYGDQNPAVFIDKLNDGSGFEVRIQTSLNEVGEYTANINVIDELGASAKVELHYTVITGNPPAIIKEFDDLFFSDINKSITLNLHEYFADPDGDDIYYEIVSNPKQIVTHAIDGDNLTITSLRPGQAEVTVKASDLTNSVSSTFMISVRDGSKPMDLYPNPATDRFFIRMGENVNGDANVKLYNSVGIKAFDANITIKPMEPGIVNITGMSPGSYTVVVNYQGTEYMGRIVKI